MTREELLAKAIELGKDIETQGQRIQEVQAELDELDKRFRAKIEAFRRKRG